MIVLRKFQKKLLTMKNYMIISQTIFLIQMILIRHVEIPYRSRILFYLLNSLYIHTNCYLVILLIQNNLICTFFKFCFQHSLGSWTFIGRSILFFLLGFFLAYFTICLIDWCLIIVCFDCNCFIYTCACLGNLLHC